LGRPSSDSERGVVGVKFTVGVERFILSTKTSLVGFEANRASDDCPTCGLDSTSGRRRRRLPHKKKNISPHPPRISHLKREIQDGS
jgi:hypothetical protein